MQAFNHILILKFYKTGIPLEIVIGATPYTSVVKFTKFGCATTPFHNSESKYASTDSGLEKYAREKLYMKKDNEEIFLIEHDTVYE